MDDKVLEPLKYYDRQGEQEHYDNITSYLQNLVDKSGVDIDANHQTIEAWKKEQEEISALSKILKKFKTFRILLILGIIIGAVLFISSFSTFSNSVFGGIIMLLLGGGAVAGSIYLMVKKVNPVIKDTNKVRDEHLAEAKRLEDEGWAQMMNLNNLFSDYDAVRLIEKTLPDFSFDKNFSVQQERLFAEKYDFQDLQTEECTMLDTLSGTYAGNPFLFGRRRIHRMGTHTYTGSLRITWTETYRDSDGSVRTRTKSETLHASVTKPKPFYRVNTFLAFGNQAAPNLSFSRETQHTENLSEKALEKKIKKGERQLQKQAKKAIKTGGTFQEMANSEFDVLFGATDRDNEMEFRLMYTPLGQRSTVELLKDKKYYGDDFDFIKNGKCNFIFSDHAQNWKMHVYANDYKHFDYEEIKIRFINLNQTFFKSVFFDFAPFFCVPAYLEEPCEALEDDQTYNTNYTYYEHEVMANALDYRSFVHSESITEAILKTQTINTEAGRDLVAVTAYSYMGIDRIDYIPVKGGDGNYHNVPVPWIEYIPVERTSHILVGGADAPTDSTTVFFHGLGAGIVNQ